MSTHRKIYTADSQASNLRAVVKSMVQGVVRSRYMGYRLFVKDIQAEYAQSAFGLVWDFVDPLVLGSIFYFLMRVRVINAGDISMPYAVFVIYGLLLYQTFCDAILMSVDLMKRSKAILTHVKVPPEALIMSVVYRVGFNSMFRLPVMLAFSLLLQGAASEQGLTSFSLPGFGLFLLCYPLLMLAGISLGVFLAPFNAVFRDVGRVVRIVLTPLRYASPVLYALPSTFPFNWVTMVNPIALILTNLRSLATTGAFVNPGELALRCTVFAVLFLLGWLIFHVSIPILAERA